MIEPKESAIEDTQPKKEKEPKEEEKPKEEKKERKESFDWESRIKTLPTEPGIYQMKGKEGQILYIGKARDLRKRVRQYFQGSRDPRPFVRKLPDLLHDIEVLITRTEKEALLLEASMIQKFQPPFNVLLKEENRFLCLRLDFSVPYPRLEVIRRGPRDEAAKPTERIFGPYMSGYAVRQTVELIDRTFRLRTCRDAEMRNRSRPCLEYHIKRCDGPCCLQVEERRYREHLQEVCLFLEGKTEELLERLTTLMQKAAVERRYEDAARYRDQIKAIGQMTEGQVMIREGETFPRDIFGIFREAGEAEIQILSYRRGRLSGGRSWPLHEQEFEDAEVLENFLKAYYLREGVEIPQEIVVPMLWEGWEEFQDILSERSQRPVSFLCPEEETDHRTMVEMAMKNAEQGFLERQKTEETTQTTLERLQKRLGLKRFPYRIECIDNSHMQGQYPVSAIVVFEGGTPNRSEYRRYHIKEAKGGDDFASMKEILLRRFRRGMKEGDLPDLMVIDGGRGQLQMALTALQDLGLEGVDVIAIAKKRLTASEAAALKMRQAQEVTQAGGKKRRVSAATDDRILVPDRKSPVAIQHPHRELFLISKLRDEAHKTAVSFHQKIHEEGLLRSVLDDIPDIGPKRKQALLAALGSVERIQGADLEELLAVKGMTRRAALALQEALGGREALPLPERTEGIEGTEGKPRTTAL